MEHGRRSVGWGCGRASMSAPPPPPPAGLHSPAVAGVLSGREAGLLSAEAVRRSLHFPEMFARRLALESTLQGHSGCVNRLAWNQEGTKLASASDDRQVLIWSYPDSEQLPTLLETEHQANIFGVAILPHSNDAKIVTGGMDSLVQLHTLETRSSVFHAWQQHRGRQGRSGAPITESAIVRSRATTQTFSCHRSRVKDVEVQPHNPNMFWSASEDGMVRQYDTRVSDQDRFESANVLLGVKKKMRAVQLKSISINKARPYEMALACGDPYVRIFDMRKLSTKVAGGDIDAIPLLELAPPHMQRGRLSIDIGQTNSTHVDFSNRGDKILATYHGDHAYCFDVTGAASAYTNVFLRHAPSTDTPAQGMERWKFNGNAAMFERDYYSAVWHYSRGLQLAPASTALLVSRASAYMQRQWEGDASFALLDCEAAIAIDPHLSRAYLIRTQALLALRRFLLASQAAKELEARFPEQHKDELRRIHETVEEEMTVISKTKLQRRITKARRLAQRERYAQERQQRRQEAEAQGVGDAEVTAALREDSADEMGGVTERWNTLLGMDRHFLLSDDSDMDESDSDDDPDREGTTMQDDIAGTSGTASIIPSVWDESQGSRRLMGRYIGQCNIQTDIKESVFLGADDNLVACGSDDGRIYIYHTETGAVVRVLDADEDVANCVQAHPTQAVLATSGIEPVVKIWSPGVQVDKTDVARLIKLNQARMKDGPQWYPRGAFQTAMRAHVLQTLTENPDLIPELRSLLTGTTGRRLPTAAPASSGGTPVLQGESTSTGSRVQGRMEPERLHAHPGEDLGQMYDMDDVDEENDHGNPYVNCRMH